MGFVTGDLVNTASRLESAAEPGMILVGEATQQAASKSIAFEPVGPQTLKGKTIPVPAWRATRVVSERRGRGRVETLEPPFVGRGDELRLLKEHVHAALQRYLAYTQPARPPEQGTAPEAAETREASLGKRLLGGIKTLRGRWSGDE